MIVQRGRRLFIHPAFVAEYGFYLSFYAECGFYFEILHEPVLAVLSFTGTGRWWLRIPSAYAVFIYNGRLFRIVLF